MELTNESLEKNNNNENRSISNPRTEEATARDSSPNLTPRMHIDQ